MVAADTGGGLLLEHDALEFDGEDYAQWRNLVNLWIKVTSVEKDKQGPFLILIMLGEALDIALELSDYNIDNILAEFDVVYGYNQSDHGFELKCSEEQCIVSFIQAVEQQYKEGLIMNSSSNSCFIHSCETEENEETIIRSSECVTEDGVSELSLESISMAPIDLDELHQYSIELYEADVGFEQTWSSTIVTQCSAPIDTVEKVATNIPVNQTVCGVFNVWVPCSLYDMNSYSEDVRVMSGETVKNMTGDYTSTATDRSVYPSLLDSKLYEFNVPIVQRGANDLKPGSSMFGFDPGSALGYDMGTALSGLLCEELPTNTCYNRVYPTTAELFVSGNITSGDSVKKKCICTYF